MDREELNVWSLSYGELDFVQGYRHAMRTGLALQLVHFRSRGYFPGTLMKLQTTRFSMLRKSWAPMSIYTICNLTLPAVTALISYAIWGFAGRMRGIARNSILCLLRNVPDQAQPSTLSLILVSVGRC
ncbi:hypothetical protein OCA8868_01287 [Octadecabacter ascidiaceicola]|uniref:Uncharacterized protein n=1 Tax=Octadecabacter ascidiaceicola TaxID=1655543 RepID=A0A238K3V4_9RHOB|nr:hypothetical protein [Octadecabacter ascidiaceicola]SMX37127.1 hypothetical protein OCA8868_01287 [Octadecabacter ascidiaceicola]